MSLLDLDVPEPGPGSDTSRRSSDTSRRRGERFLRTHVPAVQRIVVCAGTLDGRPAGTPVTITALQGGAEVARSDTRAGDLVALLVPNAPTAVLVDGAAFGAVGVDPGAADPSAPSTDAPDERTIAAAAGADPAGVQGAVSITGPGCSPAADAVPG